MMNDSLPLPPPPPPLVDEYRYEPPYVTLANPNTTNISGKSSAVAASVENTAGGGGGDLYRYASMGSLGAFRTATEFGGGGGGATGTKEAIFHRSSSSCGGGGGGVRQNIHHRHHGNFCSCFGTPAAVADISFWPTLLANLGICALMLGYILLGSFVFLTIEGPTIYNTSLSSNHFPLQTSDDKIHHKTENRRHRPPFDATIPQSALLTVRKSEQLILSNSDAMATTTTTNLNRVDTPAAVAAALPPAVAASSSFSSSSSSIVMSTEADMDDDDNGSNNNNNNKNNHNADDHHDDNDVDDMQDVERQRTVENIWDITVSLNILYKENWTKLAAMEIAKFQDQLVKRLTLEQALSPPMTTTMTKGSSRSSSNTIDMNPNLSTTSSGRRKFRLIPVDVLEQKLKQQQQQQHFEWNFATAFLYSLTVMTTVGCGHITPHTMLGRMTTIGYAALGIPLTLIYLSTVGSFLATVVRDICTRTLCCCLCTNCGYCCYDEQRATKKERQRRIKRLQEDERKLRSRQNHLSYCYVRPPPPPPPLPPPLAASAIRNDLHLDASLDSMSITTTTAASEQWQQQQQQQQQHSSSTLGISLLAPIALCLMLTLVYILFGALAFHALENWPIIDGVYFCFMTLTTIGFGDMLPGGGAGSGNSSQIGGAFGKTSTTAIWFCSAYILLGITLTATCINVLHEEILQRMRVVVKLKKVAVAEDTREKSNFYVAS